MAARLLTDSGYFGFLTSSGWLDVEYGFALQGWILKNFKLIAVIENLDEPWFSDARVKTAATILQRCDDQKRRMENVVKFVRLLKPVKEILGERAYGDEAARQTAAESLRRLILQTKTPFSNDQLRIIPGASPYQDRAGIHCRTVGDAALVLDALKDPERSYFDSRDIYTALPKGLISKKPYASFVVNEKDLKGKKGKNALEGMRIGIVREYMVKHVQNDVAISDQINDEIKSVLRDKLGAEIAESFDPKYPDDPDVANMKYTFQDALAEILPFHMPEYLSKTTSSGELEFAVPGHDVTTRDYMVKVSRGEAPLSDNLNMRRITSFPASFQFSFHLAQYLLDRGDERVNDWASLNDNAKCF